MKVINHIRELRKQKNITQKELADLLGIAPVCLWELETGRREYHRKLDVSVLENVLGVPSRDIFSVVTKEKKHK